MIDYHHEVTVLSPGKLLKLHEGCITIESNNSTDSTWEQMDIKNSISIIITEKEAEKVIDWYICAAGRSRFLRLFKDRRYSEHIDRRIADESIYQVPGTDNYILQITWTRIRLGDNPTFVTCSTCGDPFDLKYVERTDENIVCPWCKAGRT